MIKMLPQFVGNSLLNFVIWLIGAVVVLMILLAAASLVWERRRSRVGALPEQRRAQVQHALIESVYEASQNQGTAVILKNFWKGKGYGSAQRYVILKDLIDRQVFSAAYSVDKVSAFFQHLRWDWLARPVTRVRLSEQRWGMLTYGGGVVAGGDVIQVGDGHGPVQIGTRGAKLKLVSHRFAAADVAPLVAALRADADVLSRDRRYRDEAETAASIADQLENDQEKGRDSRVQSTFQSVLEIVASATTVFANTAQFIAPFLNH